MIYDTLVLGAAFALLLDAAFDLVRPSVTMDAIDNRSKLHVKQSRPLPLRESCCAIHADNLLLGEAQTVNTAASNRWRQLGSLR